MLHYFYLLKQEWLNDVLRPALAESWKRRSLAPCVPLCQALAPAVPIDEHSLVHQVLAGLTFDKAYWHALIGECLVRGADAMPCIPCEIDALCCLLAPQRRGAERADRAAFAPIEQVYFGTRDLRFGGGWHRPEHVGCNDTDDVARLTAYLQSIDPMQLSSAAFDALPELDDETEREEELAYVRDWWPALVDMYRQAQASRQVVVCERP